jgi:hypothetical protein
MAPPYFDASGKEEATFFACTTGRSIESCKSRLLDLERDILNNVNSTMNSEIRKKV